METVEATETARKTMKCYIASSRGKVRNSSLNNDRCLDLILLRSFKAFKVGVRDLRPEKVPESAAYLDLDDALDLSVSVRDPT